MDTSLIEIDALISSYKLDDAQKSLDKIISEISVGKERSMESARNYAICMIHQGRMHTIHGRLQDAEKELMNALFTSEAIPDETTSWQAYLHLALLQLERKNFIAARKYYDEKLAGKEKDERRKVFSMFLLSSLSLREHDYKAAIEKSKKLRALISSVQEEDYETTDFKIRSYAIQGNAHYRNGDVAGARAAFKNAIETMPSNYKGIGSADTYRLYGIMELEKREFSTSIELLGASLDISQSINYEYGTIKAYRHLGIAQMHLGEIAEAEHFLQQALNRCKKVNDPRLMGELYSRIGDLHSIKGQFEKARELYQEDLNISERINVPLARAHASGNLGRNYFLTGRFDLSLSHLIKALQLFRESGYDVNEGFCLLEMARVFLTQGKIKDCEKVMKRAEEIFKRHNRPYENAVIQSLQGIKDKLTGNMFTAIKKFKDAIENLEKYGNSFQLCEIYFELAKIYKEINNNDERILCLKKSLEIAERTGYMQKIQEISETLKLAAPEESIKITLQRFLTKQVVDEVMSSAIKESKFITPALISANRVIQAAAMFVDIRGYTTLTGKSTVNEIVEITNTFLSKIDKIVMDNNGYLDKLMGDGILAIFGYQHSSIEEGSRQAIKSAVTMQKELIRFGHRRRTLGQITFDIGIGIASGDMIIGSFGSYSRKQYTAIGATVNLAARLQQEALKGEIVMCARTHGCLTDMRIDGESMSLKLKGFSEPITAYRINMGNYEHLEMK
ncbi:MAG: tetratricopeptide repeat protein [bacterium]